MENIIFMKATPRFLIPLLLLAGMVSLPISAANDLPPVVLQSSHRTVSGLVTDDMGEPLPGVTVVEKGTDNKVVTDADGRFVIATTSARPLLVFSYIGMKTQSKAPAADGRLDVKLQSDDKTIEDVVVVGAYGTAQRRSDLVGSAYQVTSKDLQNMPQMRLDKLLDGLIPGVKVDYNSDSPDNVRQRYNVRVRGDASMSASNEPLWIVDGVPMYTGGSTNQMPGQSYTVSPLSFFNPDDIESITVLKDATATTLYGADGANGVILITTKHGSKGRLSMRANVQYGISNIDRSTAPKVLNASQYLELAREAYANAGLNSARFPFQDNDLNSYSTTDTDWLDVYYGTGNTLQANFSANGGSDRADYYLSASYYENKGTVKGNRSDRFKFDLSPVFVAIVAFCFSMTIGILWEFFECFAGLA